MAQFSTDIQSLTNIIDDAVKLNLKEMIKAKLMPHAESVVEEVAIQIAETLSSQIETYHGPSGEIKINVWLGPKDKPTKLKRETTYTASL